MGKILLTDAAKNGIKGAYTKPLEHSEAYKGRIEEANRRIDEDQRRYASDYQRSASFIAR